MSSYGFRVGCSIGRRNRQIPTRPVLSRNDRMAELFGSPRELSADVCAYCGQPGRRYVCRRRICKTLNQFRDTRGHYRRDWHYGANFTLHVMISYLRQMADGNGPAAQEFGKRFPHRRAAW